MKHFSLLKNNKGSGIVTVILTIAFLSTLGVLIVMLAYTSSEMRSSERTGKEVFYNAETVMEEVRAGVQKAVSDSIKDCYYYTLTEYSYKKDKGYDIDKEFGENFKEELFNWKAEYSELVDDEYVVNSDKIPLFDEAAHTYDVRVLQAMVKEKLTGEAIVSSSDNPDTNFGEIEISSDGLTITLKNIHLKYHKLLRKKEMTTDISIQCPKLELVGNNTVTEILNDFAIVVKGNLEYNPAGTADAVCTVKGDAYAGSLTVNASGTGKSFELNNSQFIVGGDVKLLTQAKLKAIGATKLWANDILVNTNCTFQVGDNDPDNKDNAPQVFVADDLELRGSNSKAIIAGSYTGFGNNLSNSQQCSAILLNTSVLSSDNKFDKNDNNKKVPKNNPLDISGARSITLAGVSFVKLRNNDKTDPSGDSTVGDSRSSDVMTGESIAAKATQKLYLAPADLIVSSYKINGSGAETIRNIKTNPEVISEDELNNIISDPNYEPKIKQVEIVNGNKPNYYGINSLKAVYVPYGNGQTIVYYFMGFSADTSAVPGKASIYADAPVTDRVLSAAENASLYFRQYFAENPDEIEGYVNKYLNYSFDLGIQTRGSEITSDGRLNTVVDESVFTTPMNAIKTTYDNLKVTLSEAKDMSNPSDNPTGATNPFDFWVKSTRIAGVDAADDQYFIDNLLNQVSNAPGQRGKRTVFFYNEEGKAIAIITDQTNFVLDISGSTTYKDPFTNRIVDVKDVILVIATNNLTLKSNFSGIVFVQGNMTVSANCELNSFNATDSKLNDAYMAESTALGGCSIRNFLRVKPSETYQLDENLIGEYWDVNSLVYYAKMY